MIFLNGKLKEVATTDLFTFRLTGFDAKPFIRFVFSPAGLTSVI